MSRTLPMVSSECVSRYCDLFTTETKELSFFISVVDNHISPYFECLFDDMRVDTKSITVVSSGVVDVVSYNGVTFEHTKELFMLVPLTFDLP